MASTQMKKIAREAAKIAAVQTYRSITSGSLKKNASYNSKVTSKDIAKAAAVATYEAIISIAQQKAVYDFFAVAGKIRQILNTAGITPGEIDDSNAQKVLIVQVKDPGQLPMAATVLKQNAAAIKAMGYLKPTITLYSTGNDDAQSVSMS